MVEDDDDTLSGNFSESVVKEIIALERRFYFDKRNAKTERKRQLKKIIERYTSIEASADDT